MLSLGPFSSLLDPVAHVSFLHMSQCTRCIPGTLNPVWDQTLLFENILIYGDPRATEQDPPIVGVEIVDYNPSVSTGVSLLVRMEQEQ